MLTGCIGEPASEKPRLFSHWKPSLAQVASDLPVHNPATLRALHQVVQRANVRAEARLQASRSISPSHAPSLRDTSPFLDGY